MFSFFLPLGVVIVWSDPVSGSGPCEKRLAAFVVDCFYMETLPPPPPPKKKKKKKRKLCKAMERFMRRNIPPAPPPPPQKKKKRCTAAIARFMCKKTSLPAQTKTGGHMAPGVSVAEAAKLTSRAPGKRLPRGSVSSNLGSSGEQRGGGRRFSGVFREPIVLGADCPFFSTMVLFKNRPFSLGFLSQGVAQKYGFSQRKPGKWKGRLKPA